MECAGMLLTGGSSRRMGRDKAAIVVAAGSAAVGGPPQMTLAERTAAALSVLSGPLLEVGPGRSGLEAVGEDPPGRGPLAAVAAGWTRLKADGWHGPTIVVATDLPWLSGRFVAWLADRPGDRPVVPLRSSRPQSLCARYPTAALERAAELDRAGARRMRDLLQAVDPVLVAEEEWSAAGFAPDVLADADTPGDLPATAVRW